jgi:hypothetical protein
VNWLTRIHHVSEFYADFEFAEIVISFGGNCSKQAQSFAAAGAGPTSSFVDIR